MVSLHYVCTPRGSSLPPNGTEAAAHTVMRAAAPSRVRREACYRRATGVLEACTPSGELDDSRLVEAAAGERCVFKRRGVAAEDEARAGAPHGKRPRRLTFVMDVSAQCIA